MGIPLAWHKRQAMMLASQLPENAADARLVLEAMAELVETFIGRDREEVPATRANNVLPFSA